MSTVEKKVKAAQAGRTPVKGQVRIQVTADVNITAPIARRLVNIELIRKVGDLIMTGESKLVVDGTKVYWKVPLLVVPTDEDENTYPNHYRLNLYASISSNELTFCRENLTIISRTQKRDIQKVTAYWEEFMGSIGVDNHE